MSTTLRPAGRSEAHHCPFCGDEDLRPHTAAAGDWECRSCLRVFRVDLLGLLRPEDLLQTGPGPDDVPEDLS